MDRYLANLLPRLRRYSKDLNKVEVFVGQSWLFKDENGNNHEYVFMRNGQLHMILNGDTITGSWELLPTGKLLIDRVTNKITLENAFIDEAIMILQKSGSSESPFFLVNAEKIPTGDIKGYLEEKEYVLQQSDPAAEKVPFLNSSGIVMGYPYLVVGQRIKTYNEDIVTGTYKTSNESYEQYVLITNNLVTADYYISTYQLKDGKSIFFRTSYPNAINKGDYVENNEELKLRTDQKIRIYRTAIHMYTVKVDAGGNVTYVYDPQLSGLLYFLLALLGIIVLAIILAYFN